MRQEGWVVKAVAIGRWPNEVITAASAQAANFWEIGAGVRLELSTKTRKKGTQIGHP